MLAIFDLIIGIANTWSGRAASHGKRRKELEVVRKNQTKLEIIQVLGLENFNI